jgi:hypothetical protein
MVIREFAEEQGTGVHTFRIDVGAGRNIGLASGKSALRANSEFSCHGGRARKVAFSSGKKPLKS